MERNYSAAGDFCLVVYWKLHILMKSLGVFRNKLSQCFMQHCLAMISFRYNRRYMKAALWIWLKNQSDFSSIPKLCKKLFELVAFRKTTYRLHPPPPIFLMACRSRPLVRSTHKNSNKSRMWLFLKWPLTLIFSYAKN